MKRFFVFLLAVAFITPLVAEGAPNWDVTGSWVVAFNYLGTDYAHDMTLSQDGGGDLTGSGGHPAGGPHVYTWVITSGSVDGSAIDFYADYTASADAVTPQTTMHVVGTIAPDGTMSGTWSDNYQGGFREGTWTSTSGMATEIYNALITGGGNIYDTKGKKTWTFGSDVGVMSVSGDEVGQFTLQRHMGGKLTCQFTTISNIIVTDNVGEYDASGTCSDGSTPTIHVVIEDNGEPGAGVDMIAVTGGPTFEPRTIDGGNFQVNEPESTLMTFTATDSAYYNGPDDTYSQYASGPFSITWDTATNLVTGGYYTEQVPPGTGTIYYNIVAGGTVSGSTFAVDFTRTDPNVYAFSGTLTLSGSTMTGTLGGPYYFTATGVVTP